MAGGVLFQVTDQVCIGPTRKLRLTHETCLRRLAGEVLEPPMTGSYLLNEALDAEDAFATITRTALARGIGRSGVVGAADSHLLPAADLVSHAVGRLDRHFPR